MATTRVKQKQKQKQSQRVQQIVNVVLSERRKRKAKRRARKSAAQEQVDPYAQAMSMAMFLRPPPMPSMSQIQTDQLADSVSQNTQLIEQLRQQIAGMSTAPTIATAPAAPPPPAVPMPPPTITVSPSFTFTGMTPAPEPASAPAPAPVTATTTTARPIDNLEEIMERARQRVTPELTESGDLILAPKEKSPEPRTVLSDIIAAGGQPQPTGRKGKEKETTPTPERDEFGNPINPNTGKPVSVRVFNEYVKQGKIKGFNMIPRTGEDVDGNLKKGTPPSGAQKTPEHGDRRIFNGKKQAYNAFTMRWVLESSFRRFEKQKKG
jgi:hypothetical protein